MTNNPTPPPADETGEPGRQQLRVVAAAVRLHDGKVVVGVRHFDQLMQQWLPQSSEQSRSVQGFVLSNYRFVDRDTAFRVAKAAKQILPGEGKHGTLYSEDVW